MQSSSEESGAARSSAYSQYPRSMVVKREQDVGGNTGYKYPPGRSMALPQGHSVHSSINSGLEPSSFVERSALHNSAPNMGDGRYSHDSEYNVRVLPPLWSVLHEGSSSDPSGAPSNTHSSQMISPHPSDQYVGRGTSSGSGVGSAVGSGVYSNSSSGMYHNNMVDVQKARTYGTNAEVADLTRHLSAPLPTPPQGEHYKSPWAMPLSEDHNMMQQGNVPNANRVHSMEECSRVLSHNPFAQNLPQRQSMPSQFQPYGNMRYMFSGSPHSVDGMDVSAMNTSSSVTSPYSTDGQSGESESPTKNLSMKKRKRCAAGGRLCKYPKCSKSAQTGGYCRPHGGGSRCKHEDCNKCAQKGGYCTRHGGGVRCGVADCPKGAQIGGFCVAHGGGRRCKSAGCTKSAQKGQYCVTHGGAWRCSLPGCNKLDAGRGLCIRHGGGRRCQHQGCNKLDKGGGYCVAHGKKMRKDMASSQDMSPECSSK